MRVEDRVDAEPAHRPAGPPHDPHPGGVLAVPDVRHRRAASGGRRVEGDREVEHDDVFPGEREVVHHRRVRHRDPGRAGDAPGGVHDQVPDVVPGRVVSDRVEFTGVRVVLGVGGERPLQGAPEVVGAHRVQLAVQFVRQRTALLQREDPPLIRDHMRVAGEVLRRHRTRVGLTELVRHLGGAHPTVPVPLRPPVAQPYPVHHALAEHPVVRAGVLQAEDVGAVAQEAAAQPARDAAGDRQVERRQLLGDRLERPLQKGKATSRRGPSRRSPCRPGRGLVFRRPGERARRREPGRTPQHRPPCVFRHRPFS